MGAVEVQGPQERVSETTEYSTKNSAEQDIISTPPVSYANDENTSRLTMRPGIPVLSVVNQKGRLDALGMWSPSTAGFHASRLIRVRRWSASPERH